MNVQGVLHSIDGISTWVGKAFAWLMVLLMTVVCVEVFKRYLLNAPTAWIFDAENMRQDLSLVIGGAARVDVAIFQHRLERRRIP